MTTKLKALLGVGLAAGIGVAIVPLASYAGTDTRPLDVRVSVAEDITITETANTAEGLNIAGADQANGAVVTGNHTVTILTNNVAGYTLSMSANADTLSQGTTPAWGGTVGFDSVVGTFTAPGTTGGLQTATGGTGTITAGALTGPTGVWGWQMGAMSGFAAVPTTPTVIARNSGASAAAPGDAIIVTFSAKAGTTTPSGTYGATITYLAATQ
jgi:hypothetical protein